MSTQEQGYQQDQVEARKQVVEVRVDYLPAVRDYEHPYERDVILETVRVDAMHFFGVQDRTVGRDTYKYYLVYGETRLDNTQVTLEQVIGEHAHEAKFTLVEEITTGAADE
jgi:hypothetical protein